MLHFTANCTILIKQQFDKEGEKVEILKPIVIGLALFCLLYYKYQDIRRIR